MKKLQNRVIFVVDRSGSMSHLTTKTVDMLNDQIKTIKQLDKSYNQETLVSLIVFNDNAEIRFENKPSDGVPTIVPSSLYAAGGTALLDAVSLAAKLGLSEGESEISYVVNVLTDGYENQSRKTTKQELVKTIAKLQATDRWTFTFQLPPGNMYTFCNQFGIPEDNCREWQASSKGLEETSTVTRQALGAYYQARSTGQKSVKNFYKMQTDLSSLSAKKVKNELSDLSGEFRLLSVTKESVIRDFVEEKTNRTYVPGSCYYQLIKDEKIQTSKEILLRDKTTGKIFGGSQARQLIGLPDNQPAKVTPGNHSNWDIFTQSKSVNRILPRGTKLLVRK